MATFADSSSLTWYTLLDPTTEQFFYACPATGACSWNPPTTGSILQGHLPDWWEMFDESTGRPYYFNNKTQATLWVLPQDLNVIPVPLSSEDDAKIRNVLGPPPEVGASDIFSTEEVFDASEEDELEEPEPEMPAEASPTKSSPRRLATNETTKSEWVAMEDPRTGYNYFMNRKTMKLAWSRVEMLHQEIAAEEAKQDVRVEAPSPVAFKGRKSTDPDYTTDAWEDRNVPVAAASSLPKLPGIHTSSSGLALDAKKAGLPSSSGSSTSSAAVARPSKAPPVAPPGSPGFHSPQSPASPAPHSDVPTKPHSGSVSSNGSSGSSSNSPPVTSALSGAPGGYLENRKGSVAVAPAHSLKDPSIPTPPPATIPVKNYRVSIFMRPLPSPSNSRQNLAADAAHYEQPPLEQPPARPTPAGTAKGAPKQPAAEPKPRTESHMRSETKPRTESHAPPVTTRPADDRHRSTSYDNPIAGTSPPPSKPNGIDMSADVINVAQVFKRPVPAGFSGAPSAGTAKAPKGPGVAAAGAAAIVNSSSASSIAPKSAIPPLPASISQKFPTATVSGRTGAAPVPGSSSHTNHSMITSSAPPTSMTSKAGATPVSPPSSLSSRQMAPKPFTGPPPPIPNVRAGSSRPPAHAPPNPSVLVTLDRGRAGSRTNRISFRASISRVAPPTMAEIYGEHAAWAGGSSLPNASPLASTSPPNSGKMRPAPGGNSTPAIGPVIGMPTRVNNTSAIASVLSSIPLKAPAPLPKQPGLRTSQSANTLGPSTPNPYANSLPAVKMEALRNNAGAPATTKASTAKPRPALVKAFTATSPFQEPHASPSNAGGFGRAGPPTISADLKAQIKHFQLEGFASQFFKSQKKGLFRRAVPIRDRLKWTQGGLKGPLLKLKPDLAKKAVHVFKCIQICMGDRELNTTQDERYKLMVEIFDLGLNIAALRDEIFCQLCKQTTLNPNADSNLRGWTMITLFLQYFTPTKDLEHWLMDYCREHEKNPQKAIVPYVDYALRVLSRPSQSGSTLRVPEPDEVELAILNPLQPRLFGVSLDQVLQSQKLQRCPEAHAKPDFPFIISALIAIITRLRGVQTEGIFRIPGSHMQCTKLRLQLESGLYNGEGLLDPHVPASVLKWWLRDLESPVIPPLYYNVCIEAAKSSSPDRACIAAIDSLPPLNKAVVYHLIKFVQLLAKPENIAHTKMAVGSLSIVFSPNLLRTQATEMMAVFEAQKWEQTFVTNLINHLPTSNF